MGGPPYHKVSRYSSPGSAARLAVDAIVCDVQGAEFDEADFFRALTALAALDHHPNHSADAARARGRYVLENGEHIDVMVARAHTTKEGERVSFEEVWQRKFDVPFDDGVTIPVPSLEDLIRTKRWAVRAKDVGDIQLLEALRRSRGEGP